MLNTTSTTMDFHTLPVDTSYHPAVNVTNEWLNDFVFYSEAVVQNTIFSFGMIFNIVNYIIIYQINIAPQFRVCLLALTVTDFGTCLFGVLQLTVEAATLRGRIQFGYWHTGALTSHMLYYIFAVFACTSSVYVLLGGGMRTYMISRPYNSLSSVKPSRVALLCMSIFLVVCLLFVPSQLYAFHQVCYYENNEICSNLYRVFPKLDKMKYYLYALSIIFIPTIVIGNVICLVKIKIALNKSAKRVLRVDRYQTKQGFSITKTLTVILFLDTIWIMPYCIQYLTLAFSPRETIFNINNSAYIILDIFVEILYTFRPTYNIFVYLLTNSNYRQKFNQIFCICHERKHKDHLQTMDTLSPEGTAVLL